MHPMMILALAGEVARQRRRDRQADHVRSLELANRAGDVDGSHGAVGFVRRLLAGIDLRPRLSSRPS